MGLLRLLALVALVFALLWLVRRLLAGADSARATRRRRDAGPRESATPMVCCAHCGLHLALADALAGPTGSQLHYCCAAHRQAGPQQHGPGGR